MDVSRRYYEEVEEFVRAIGKNAHRRRHLPFWNLALGALASSEASAVQSQLGGVSGLTIGGTLNLAPGGGGQSALSDGSEPVGAFSRALTQSSGRVLYVSFHTSANSHVAPMTNYSHAGGPFASATSDDVLVASAILTNSLIVLFCADDTLDALVSSWIYAEIISAQRGRSSQHTSGPNNQPSTSRMTTQNFQEKNTSGYLTTLPSSFKSLRFTSRVALYGSMAHVRALLDLACNAASDPKFQPFSSLDCGSGAPSSSLYGSHQMRRFVPNDFRMSRDDSGMRVLGNRQIYRQSIRPQTSEFAFGPSVFKRRTRNAYRMFFIATERLEAIDKKNAELATLAILKAAQDDEDEDSGSASSSGRPHNLPAVHDHSKLILDAEKCLRIATAADWDELKAILKNENPDTGDAEDDNDFDSTLESVQKGNVYVWESARRREKGTRVGKPKIRCFAVLDFHTRPLPELSCVEIIDLHVSNPSRDTDTARMLTESLSRKFLTATLAAPAPYHFLFVKVDVSVTEASDAFLLDCGFVADSVADFVTLEGRERGSMNLSHQMASMDPFEITRVVKMSPLTEKPFSAYEIRINETGELVRKRYREFDKLYDQLKAQLSHMNIPKLPKKKLFGNMDEAFVEKRRLQLQNWLNTVSRIPGVEESGWVSNFLWTELKIRGVKHISEAERFHRTLQKQAEEARLTAVQSANASTAALSPQSMAWPSTRQPTEPKPATMHTTTSSLSSSSSSTHASSSSNKSSASPVNPKPSPSVTGSSNPSTGSKTASNSAEAISSSSTASSTTSNTADPAKPIKAGRRKDKKGRRLSQ